MFTLAGPCFSFFFTSLFLETTLYYVFLKPFKGIRSRSNMPIVLAIVIVVIVAAIVHMISSSPLLEHGSLTCLTCFVCLFVLIIVVVTLSHTQPLSPWPYLYKVGFPPLLFPFPFPFPSTQLIRCTFQFITYLIRFCPVLSLL